MTLSTVATDHIDKLVQERRNSNALAMELRLSYTNRSIWWFPCYNINFDRITEYYYIFWYNALVLHKWL